MDTIDKEKLTETLTNWLICPRREEKVCLVTLPQGMSVVSHIHAAVKDACMESVTVDMNGLHGVDLYAAARSPIAVTFKKKVILVFDYDAIVSNNQPFLSHITNAMKLNIVPVVLIAQVMTGKSGILPVKLYRTISVASPQNDEWEIVCVYSKGRGKDLFHDKGLDGATRALQGVTDIDYRGDNIAFGGVFDNYLSVCPNEYVSTIADTYSWSDIISDSLYGCSDDMYSYVPIMTAAASISMSKTMKKRKEPVTTFGVVWSKNNARFAKARNIQSIQKTMLEHHCIPQTLIGGMDIIRTIMTHLAHTKQYQSAAEMAHCIGLTPASLLLFMRLWKTKYTLSMHSKIKAHFMPISQGLG